MIPVFVRILSFNILLCSVSSAFSVNRKKILCFICDTSTISLAIKKSWRLNRALKSMKLQDISQTYTAIPITRIPSYFLFLLVLRIRACRILCGIINVWRVKEDYRVPSRQSSNKFRVGHYHDIAILKLGLEKNKCTMYETVWKLLAFLVTRMISGWMEMDFVINLFVLRSAI